MNKKAQNIIVVLITLVVLFGMIWFFWGMTSKNNLESKAIQICKDNGMKYSSYHYEYYPLFRYELTNITCEKIIPNPNLVVIDIKEEEINPKSLVINENNCRDRCEREITDGDWEGYCHKQININGTEKPVAYRIMFYKCIDSIIEDCQEGCRKMRKILEEVK